VSFLFGTVNLLVAWVTILLWRSSSKSLLKSLLDDLCVMGVAFIVARWTAQRGLTRQAAWKNALWLASEFRFTLLALAAALVVGFCERSRLLSLLLQQFDNGERLVGNVMLAELCVLPPVAVCVTMPFLAAEGVRFACRCSGVEGAGRLVLGVGLASALVWLGAFALALELTRHAFVFMLVPL
jgi:hypothetical protein